MTMGALSRRATIATILGIAGGVAVLTLALIPPIPQDPAYHRLADGRTLLGVPNAFNVLSNAPFVTAGLAGLAALGAGRAAFVDPRERWPYAVFFAGLILTGFGSAYYHLAPGNARLVWDRLPLAITLMGLFAAVIAERVGVTAGLRVLGPLVAVGIGSVLQWQATEARGAGDLRLYGLVQFFPMLAVPLLLAWFPPRYTRGADLIVAVGVYAGAKLFELLDRAILQMGHVISGHTLKHLLVGVTGYWIVRMLRARAPMAAALQGRH
jgi:hypothetical protein